MRHANHRYILGVTKAHRLALMSNLSAALFRHKRIQTTLAKAKALKSFAEKVITLAKKAYLAEDPAVKVHYRRLAIKEVRDKEAVAFLFNTLAQDFVDRPGGYTRIYKLGRRRGDAAEVAYIELVGKADAKYLKRSEYEQQLLATGALASVAATDEAAADAEENKE
jgi:large subunit ribosomal protein L17